MGKRIASPKISLDERKKTFREVEKTIPPHHAMSEASRCLFCHDAPCDQLCPAGIKPSQFIRKIKTKNFIGASRLIRDGNFLGSVCARICPVEKQCEKGCSQSDVGEPINIAALQRYAADKEPSKIKLAVDGTSKGKKAAVIGAGPAGLTCAMELYKKGWDVIVYEKSDRPGGLLVWGIPEYRLPRDVVIGEISIILNSQIKMELNKTVGKELFSEILKNNDAVFLGVGLGDSSKPNIHGENLEGVYQALDFLRELNSGRPRPTGKKVVVIGGGSTALDCAASSVRLGAESVAIFYRRTEAEMPGTKAEFEEAREVGVKFEWLTAPKKILGGDKVTGVEFVKCKLGEPDGSGRPRPQEVDGSEHVVEADTVIFALGQKLSDSVSFLSEYIDVKNGKIQLNTETLATSNPKVFAGGDVAGGGATVAQAVGDGKRAAENIDKLLG